MALDDLGRLTTIAARQHGVVSVAQAAEIGIDRRRLNRLQAAGLLVRLQPDVYAMAAPPPGRWQVVWAAVLQVGPPSIGALVRTLRQVNRRGRRHVGRLEVVLDARMPGQPAPRSTLERDADLLLARSLILPAPSCEYPLPGRVPRSGLVDRAWPDAGLIFEIDGRRWHSREADMAEDRARDRAAAAAGWLTLRVLDEEVDSVGEAVLADIEQTYLSRLGRFAVTLP